jgi:hypothetical protein
VDSLRRIGSRLVDLATTLLDAFVRDNRVLPPVLAVLALFVIAWILAGAFMGEPDQKTVAHKADLAQSDGGQSDNGNAGGNPPPRGVENRDVNSYAAYRSKDPFREILAPEKTTTEPAPTPERTTRETTRETTPGPGRGPGRGPRAGGAAKDTDADGVPDRRERSIRTDPNNADTDGDGRPDGSDDDANGDGLPDTGGAGAGSDTGTGATPGQSGRPGARTPGRNDDLLNSGGILPLP